MNNFNTLLAGLDHYTDNPTGGLVPSINPAVTFSRGNDSAALNYSRSGNATTVIAEQIMMKMECGEGAALFNSGVSAAWAILLTLSPGDTIIVEHDCYYEFRNIMISFCNQHHITILFLDLNELDILEESLSCRKISFVWAETSTNPLWKVIDIKKVSDIVKKYSSRLIIDATVSTPLSVQPLTLGADIVLHSATKYLNGHGDLTAGFLICTVKDEWWEKIMNIRTGTGLILQSFDAWLLLRGMRTLSLRFSRACSNAYLLARWLTKQKEVSHVFYPGLESTPSFNLATEQFNGIYGAMVSFRLTSGADAAYAVTGSTEIFRNSTSLGSSESLIEYRKGTEGEYSSCPDDLIRLSVGIEDPNDLLQDLEHAIKKHCK